MPFLLYWRRKPEVAEPGADRLPGRDCQRVRDASDIIHSNHRRSWPTWETGVRAWSQIT